MNKVLSTFILAISVAAATTAAHAQSVRLDDMKSNFKKENLIKLSGGLSANAVFDGGAGESQRQPFTWFVNGNLSARLFNLIDLPFSVFLTNSGRGLNYPTPPNRLSFHPTYKWATAHIGDVAMTFSPYTLNGHQFTGVGVDLAPPGHWKVSAMYGRLQKATPFDTANHSAPVAYRRMGYGARVGYETEKWRVAYTAFSARDEAGSIGFVPDSLGITPLQNVVMSGEGSVKIIKGLELSAEYANTGMTSDARDTLPGVADGGGVVSPFLPKRSTTAYYKAYKAMLSYAFAKTIIGIGFEHIDPGYRTLGAYYFNEDMENYTFNVSQTALKDKLSLSANIGFQRDDLDGRKSGSNKRIIGAVNVTYTASERLSLSANYSNFQTHMHIKSQFEAINQVGPYINYDTLRFTQISQNAMANVYYLVSTNETRIHGLNVNVNFLDAVDKQGDVIRADAASRFYNTALSYSLQFVKTGLNISAGFNGSYNAIGASDFTTMGPIASVNAPLFHRKLITSLATSYNISSGTGTTKSDVFNTRLSATYNFLKTHSLNLGILNQLRNGPTGNNQHLMVTMAYGFRF